MYFKKTKANLYMEYKGKIREEEIYDNTYASELLFVVRANSLDLNDLKKHTGDTICDICRKEKEDLINFIVGCKEFEDRRDRGRDRHRDRDRRDRGDRDRDRRSGGRWEDRNDRRERGDRGRNGDRGRDGVVMVMVKWMGIVMGIVIDRGKIKVIVIGWG